MHPMRPMQAFKFYDEAGVPWRVSCLEWVLYGVTLAPLLVQQPMLTMRIRVSNVDAITAPMRYTLRYWHQVLGQASSSEQVLNHVVRWSVKALLNQKGPSLCSGRAGVWCWPAC